MACRHYHYSRIVIFYVNNIYGSSVLDEFTHHTDCEFNVLGMYTFSYDRTDFRKEIMQAKELNAQIFLLAFDDSVMASKLVEQGYDLGLFRQSTQLFGTEAVSSPNLWKSFKNKENTAAIMKGFIGIQYDPSYSTRTSSVGLKFIDKFRKLPSIGGATNSCYVDKSGIFSVQSIPKFTACYNLNFSAFAADGSDIHPYAPHAYDAVYGLAHAMNHLLEVNRALTLNDEDLMNSFVDSNVVNFEGVTGRFEIMPGSDDYPYETRGDREIGVAYKLYNYNAEAEDIVFVGKFSDDTVEFCNSSYRFIDGIPCKDIVFNTADNSRPGDTAPFSLQTLPEVVKLGGFFTPFDLESNPDPLQAQCLAAFLLAINEINRNKTFLPKTKLVSGIVSGAGFQESISGADYLAQKAFGGTGVDIVVGAGDDIETQAMNQIFTQNQIIQIHTIAQSVEMSQSALYPWRLQTTPLQSYQGVYYHNIFK